MKGRSGTDGMMCYEQRLFVAARLSSEFFRGAFWKYMSNSRVEQKEMTFKGYLKNPHHLEMGSKSAAEVRGHEFSRRSALAS